jgi:hypothetical protein
MENPRAGWTSGLAKSTYRWALDKVVDVNGNETTLSYVKHDNLLYLDEILYNGHTGGISKTHAVEFNLEDRSDVFFSYKSNFRVALKKRLTEVIVKIGGTRIRRYALQYSTSSSTTRSLLQSVTVYGPTDSDALPPTTFSYQVKPFEFEAQTDWTGLSSQGQSAYYWNSIHGSYKGDAFVTLADIDGDGLVDRVMRKAASPYTNFVAERNTGSNFLANDYRWYPLESQGQTSYTWNSIYVDDSENVAMIKFLDIMETVIPTG